VTAASTAPRRTPRHRPKDRKQQIILQARELFVETGFPNVSMALIAERLGITAGALYRHFENKQVLLEAVIAESFGYLDDTLAADTYEAAIDDAIERLIGYPYVAELWTNESRYLTDQARAELRQKMRDWAHAFVPVLRRQRADLDPGQAELVAWGLQSVLAFLGSFATRVPSAARRPVVRAAALALARTDLLPSGKIVPSRPPAFSPISTREKLLQSAIEQFAERGYRDTAMSSIGAAAEVTGPNLYVYFASKADLLRSVHDRVTHAAWLNLDAALRDATSAGDALDRLVAGHIGVTRTWDPLRMDLIAELGEQARSDQREYAAEWFALARQLVPDLDIRDVRLRVLIAFMVMNDLNRTPHLRSYESFPANLAAIALAILKDSAPVAS
jgi:AcrR family transcriptional regulator